MKQELYAFWKYDLAPYVLGGVVIEFTVEGRVRIKGYDNMTFKPIKILPGQAGAKALAEIKKLRNEYAEAEAELREKFKRAAYIGQLGLIMDKYDELIDKLLKTPGPDGEEFDYTP